MPQPSRQPRRSDPQLALDLARSSSTPTLPSWSALPAVTQQTLTRLLTRLLVAHADSVPQQDIRDIRVGGADER